MPATPSDPGALARLVAHEEIRQLAAHYAVALDARDLDQLVDLFVPDVWVGRDASGRAALRRDFEASLRPVGVTILTVGTHAIDLVDADQATGVVYCHGEVQVGEDWVHQAILYRDTYARVPDEGWRFVRRVHELWYGVVVTPNPLDQPPADWPLHAVGRGTVPESWPTWGEFWGGPA
ncbi:MAG: nuclear transport factor 2 family protein [Acidimicrobiales bacterium]